jgi:membrane-bound metal-dependent hydrolase YbcI (DUF457 family)
VPFTPAHAAAALPFRRLRLVTSALVIGTFAPDFEYFIRLSPGGGFGHTFLGAFVFTLPLALVVLFLYQAIVKAPLIWLMPVPIQRRLVPYQGKFRFFPAARFALILLSLLLGIATHIAWDSFTHANRWPSRHWQFLSRTVHVPILGTVPIFKALQHGSSLIGMGILAVWGIYWYLVTKPSSVPAGKSLSAMRKFATLSFGIFVACVGAGIRIFPEAVADSGHIPWKTLLGYAICTWIPLAWWQLVAYGLMSSRRAKTTLTNLSS